MLKGSKSDISKVPAPTFSLEYKNLNTNVTIKRVNKNAKIYFKVNNIFDKFYAEHSNARYNWSADPDGQWWRAPGRSFLVGMEYAF